MVSDTLKQKHILKHCKISKSDLKKYEIRNNMTYKKRIWNYRSISCESIPELLQKFYNVTYNFEKSKIKLFHHEWLLSPTVRVYTADSYFIEFVTEEEFCFNIFTIIDDYFLFKLKQKQLKRRFVKNNMSSRFLQEAIHDWVWKCRKY